QTQQAILRSALKAYSHAPKAQRPSHIPAILSALNNYIPYLFALSSGLDGKAVNDEEVDVVLRREVECEWTSCLAATDIMSLPRKGGRGKKGRVKMKGIDAETVMVLTTLATVHRLIAREQLRRIYTAGNAFPEPDARTKTVAGAMKGLLTANGIHVYLSSLCAGMSSTPTDGKADAYQPSELCSGVQNGLAELAMAEATLLAVLKDDPYPAVVIQTRDKNDKEWMVKAPEIPKVRAHLFARLCIAAGEHAGRAEALLSSSISKRDAMKVDDNIIDYSRNLKRSARAKACRFFGIDEELGGRSGEAIAWLQGAMRELEFPVAANEDRKGWTKGWGKVKKGLEEKREDKRIEKGGDWGADAGRMEEARVVEMLERKWVKMNDTVRFDFFEAHCTNIVAETLSQINTQLIPPSEPLLAGMPSGREIHSSTPYAVPELDAVVLEKMRAPPDPDDAKALLNDDDSSEDETSADDDGSPVAPSIQKKELLSVKEIPDSQPSTHRPRPSTAALKVLKSSTIQPPQVPTKGLLPADTELIMRSVAKAMSKPVEHEIPNNTTDPESQVPTNGPSPVRSGIVDRNIAAATSNSTVRDAPSIKTPLDESTTTAAHGASNDIKAQLDGQRADIDRIVANVDSLMRDMKIIKASMDYLKFQQKTFAEHDTAPSPTTLAEDIHVLTRETQNLTETVANFRTKATEVEEIKKELGSLKQRMQYLEDVSASEGRTANAPAQSTILATRREKERRSNSHALSESLSVSDKVQGKHSSTLLGALSAQASASRRTNTYSLPPDIVGNGHTRESRSSDQLYAMSLTSDEDMTPENESTIMEEPQITSAAKVAAQQRRRLSDSSSDGRPTKKRGRPPRFKGKPDWTTKPISLNNHQAILTSDPEDDTYDPNKHTQGLKEPHSDGRHTRAFGKAPVRIPTPEWEKPDWEGPSNAPPANSTRGKTTVRRGVSGRPPLTDRDTLRRRSSGYGNGDYVYFDSPQYWEDQSPMSTQSPSMRDPFEKPRDSQGRLIRQNGKVDGRSLRHKRAREEKARQAALQQQLQMASQEEKKAEGQQKQMQAMGLAVPTPGQSFIDAAALQAARLPGAASPATPAPAPVQVPDQMMTVDDGIKEGERISGNDDDNAAGPLTTAGMTAPRPQSDKHAVLMKQMFPWR
ncbi:MAG: hypothetical protein Q9213_007195, partial [Squamulea squamosa]